MHLLAEVSSRVPPAVPPTNGSLSPLPSLKKSLSFSFDEPAGQKRFFDDVVQSSPASSISGTSSEGDAEATCVVALVCDEDSVTQQYRMGLAAPVARHATGDINVATDDEGGSLDRTWDSDRRVVTASRSQGARVRISLACRSRVRVFFVFICVLCMRQRLRDGLIVPLPFRCILTDVNTERPRGAHIFPTIT